MTTYGNKQFWVERYQNEKDQWDWYCQYPTLKEHIGSFFKPGQHVLDLGCGSSRIAEQLYAEGIENIECVDYVQDIVDKMRVQYKELKNIKWHFMDAERLSKDFKPFDVVFDKGTIDSILTGYHSHEKIKSVLSEVSRVLKDDGVFISISHADVNYRNLHFKQPRYCWDVSSKSFPQYDGAPPEQKYHIYVMKKNPALREAQQRAAGFTED